MRLGIVSLVVYIARIPVGCQVVSNENLFLKTLLVSPARLRFETSARPLFAMRTQATSILSVRSMSTITNVSAILSMYLATPPKNRPAHRRTRSRWWIAIAARPGRNDASPNDWCCACCPWLPDRATTGRPSPKPELPSNRFRGRPSGGTSASSASTWPTIRVGVCHPVRFRFGGVSSRAAAPGYFAAFGAFTHTLTCPAGTAQIPSSRPL